jgi:hypothetical protein
MQLADVAAGVADAMTDEPYRIRCVSGTRIGYAVKQ